ncbi:MAG: hypothetical protein J2P57_08390 [Acidimicrobiaceae bacterium]|nr:hypothetical protein [Acidimicrobiaceae bacterium]
MTGLWMDLDVEELAGDQLAVALDAAAQECSWGYRAAVGLIVEQGSWLYRWEFRQAAEAEVDEDGRVVAWVNWEEIDIEAPASSGELRILHLARSLAGVPSTRPLCDLLTSLDDHNLARVLRAFHISARGTAAP